MDLPALQTIPFLHGNGLAVHGGTGMDLPTQSACWPMAIVAGMTAQHAYAQTDDGT